MNAEVGQQVEVLHEVRPVVFIRIVPALRLHEVALFIKLREGSVLGIAAGSDFGQNLHLLLILPELKLVGSQCLLLFPCELAGRPHFVDILLVEALESGYLVLMYFFFPTQAKTRKKVEICWIGVFGIQFFDKFLNVIIIDLLEG